MKRAWVTGLCALWLQGCSGVTTFYNHIDKLVPNYVDGYVTLTDAQGALLDRQMADLLDWHCATQLNDYATWLRTVNADIQGGHVTPELLASRYAQMEVYWKRIMQQVSPRVAQLMRTASDEQVEEMFRNLERENREYRARKIDRPVDELERQHRENLEKQLKRWIGELTSTQRTIVKRWGRELTPIAADRLETRKRWQAQLHRLLRHRTETPVFSAGIDALLVHPDRTWTETYRRKYAANRKLIFKLLAEVGSDLNARQRRHLAERVLGWANKIDQLACAGTQAPNLQTGTPASP